MLNLKSKFAVVTAAASILTLSALEAHADSYKKEAWGKHGSAKIERYHDRDIVLHTRVHRAVQSDRIPLRRLLGLDRHHNGYRVESVTVTTRKRGGFGRINLLVNGRRVDSEFIRGVRTVSLEPKRFDVIGREIRSLALEVRGRAFIKDVRIKLVKPSRRGDRVYHNRDHHHDRVVIQRSADNQGHPLIIFARILNSLPR